MLGLAITHKQWQLVHGTRKMMHQKNKAPRKIQNSQKFLEHPGPLNSGVSGFLYALHRHLLLLRKIDTCTLWPLHLNRRRTRAPCRPPMVAIHLLGRQSPCLLQETQRNKSQRPEREGGGGGQWNHQLSRP